MNNDSFSAVDFAPAEREQSRATIGLSGASGGGKTFTALALLSGLLGPKPTPSMTSKIAVIDTDGGASRKYAKGRPFYFSVADLRNFSPEAFMAQIRRAEEMGFECLLVDNICDEWEWVLGEIDNLKKKMDTRSAWGVMTPRHNAFIRCLTKTRMHVVASVLSKQAYAEIDDERKPGKKKMQKIGLQPIQREGIERLFDIFGDMSDGVLTITKTRCSPLFQQSYVTPGIELATIIKDWLVDGVDQEGFERAVVALPGSTGTFREAQEKAVVAMLIDLAAPASLSRDDFSATKARIERAFHMAKLDRETGERLMKTFTSEVKTLVEKQKSGGSVVRPDEEQPTAAPA